MAASKDGGLVQQSLTEMFERWGQRALGSDAVGGLGADLAVALRTVMGRSGLPDTDAALLGLLRVASEEEGARELTRLLEAALPVELRALTPREETSEIRRRRSSEGPQSPENINDRRIQLAGDAWPALEPAYKQFAELENIDIANWTPRRVATQLAWMLGTSQGRYPNTPDRDQKYPHRARFEIALNHEIDAEFEPRVLIAAALEEAYSRYARPGRQTGTEVHIQLQERYRHHRKLHRIVQESWVYRPYRAPITIAQASAAHGFGVGNDHIYAILDLARLTDRPPVENIMAKFRWDIVDLSLGQIWEIKPAQSLHQGVLQETFYRNKINYNVLAYVEAGLNVSTTFLEPGRADIPLYDLYPGDELVITHKGRVIMPFAIAELSGLVGYVVVGDEEEMQSVRKTIRRFLEAMDRARRATAEAAIVALWFIVGMLLIGLIILILLFLLGLIPRAPGPRPPAPGPIWPPPTDPGPGPGPGPPAPGPIRPPPTDPVLPAGVELFVRTSVRGTGIVCEVFGAAEPTVSLNLGMLTVHRIPAQTAGELLARIKETFGQVLRELEVFRPA